MAPGPWLVTGASGFLGRHLLQQIQALDPPRRVIALVRSQQEWDSMAWTRRLLADTGVALAPGIDFDTVVGQQHVRLSFAGPELEVRTVLARLGEWLPAQRVDPTPG